MRGVAFFSCLLILSACSGCSSSSSSSDRDGNPNGEASAPAVPRPPNVMKQNATAVQARIDSIAVSDSVSYRLAITIDSAAQVGGIDSFAEAGQQISVAPDYVTDEHGKLEASNDRNRRLMAVRTLRAGDRLRGIVSLRSTGGWVLTDVLQPLK